MNDKTINSEVEIRTKQPTTANQTTLSVCCDGSAVASRLSLNLINSALGSVLVALNSTTATPYHRSRR